MAAPSEAPREEVGVAGWTSGLQGGQPPRPTGGSGRPRSRLREADLDHDRPLLPAYPAGTWARRARIDAVDVFPGVSEEALQHAGAASLDGCERSFGKGDNAVRARVDDVTGLPTYLEGLLRAVQWFSTTR